MSATILKLGWTNPLTDAFGAHPRLGAVLDLNDGVTFTLTSPDGLDLPPPPRTLVTAGNIRTQGERATRAIYRHNRQAVARVLLGPMASFSDLAANLRTLVAWMSAPPAIPFSIQYQPPGASAPVYLDVVGAAHDIPEDEGDWLRLQLEPIELIFIARPGLRGDRVWLQNLVVNPGFEAPSGPGVQVFNDSFASTNAYALVAGTTPTVASNILTLPAGTLVTFGSPAWGAINQWVVRFQMPSGAGGLNAYLHYTDANDYLRVNVLSTALTIQHDVAGASVNIAQSGALTTTAGNLYWLVVTQFPTVPGDPAYVTAALYADSSGSRGALVMGSNIAGATQEISGIGSTVALSGLMALQNSSSASIGIGGAFANVHTVALFGPGGWWYQSDGGSNAASSGAWEQTSANCYAGGPVQSYGAARVDCAPAGLVSAFWNSADLTSASSIQSTAYPTAGGVSFGVSAWFRSAGIGAGCTQQLIVSEYASAGGFVKSTVISFLTGAQAVWTQLSGTLTTQPTTAFLVVQLRVQDPNTGNPSANGTVWIENVQLWQTSKGASMPYCELRFPQSPAQLVVSGLLGDLPAPAFLAFGTYLTSWPLGGTLTYAVGRRGTLSATARLAAASNGYYGAALSPTATCALDASSYGGYYSQAVVTSAGWNPRAFSFTPADAPGTYHLLGRFLTQQAAGNLGNVEVRAAAQQRLQPWYGLPDSSDQTGSYYAPFVNPISASNTWTVVDAGQMPVPPLNQGALADPTQTYLTPRQQWSDLTAGGSLCQIGWQLLLPVDGSLLAGILNNPTNAPKAITNAWLWAYFDGIGAPNGLPVAWTYSLETVPQPNPAHAGGGPGTQSTGGININSGADPYLALDPQQQLSGAGGVNVLAAYLTDTSAAVLPFYAELAYSPLYLYPR